MHWTSFNNQFKKTLNEHSTCHTGLERDKKFYFKTFFWVCESTSMKEKEILREENHITHIQRETCKKISFLFLTHCNLFKNPKIRKQRTFDTSQRTKKREKTNFNDFFRCMCVFWPSEFEQTVEINDYFDSLNVSFSFLHVACSVKCIWNLRCL